MPVIVNPIGSVSGWYTKANQYWSVFFVGYYLIGCADDL